MVVISMLVLFAWALSTFATLMLRDYGASAATWASTSASLSAPWWSPAC